MILHISFSLRIYIVGVLLISSSHNYGVFLQFFTLNKSLLSLLFLGDSPAYCQD